MNIHVKASDLKPSDVKAKAQVGDLVELIEDFSGHGMPLGSTGVVIGRLDASVDVCANIKFDGIDRYKTVNDQWLKVLGRAFPVGQKVKINSPDAPCHGMIGKVKKDDARTRSITTLVDLDGSMWWFSPDRLERVSDIPSAEPQKDPKFEVGDRVVMTRAVSSHISSSPATIIEDRGHRDFRFLLRFDRPEDWMHDGEIGGQDRYWIVGARDIKHAEQPRTATPSAHCIVAKMDGNEPRPARQPHIHDSKDLAWAEAGRLAKINRGQEFGVYQFNGSIKETMFKYEWQNLAADGREDNAVLALRKHSGIALRPARAAVAEFLRDEL